MTLDIKQFFQATNPSRTLFVEDVDRDRKYYIDFSPVRGGQIIEELKDNIALWSPEDPTYQLFTGHVGCGKSTELRRLKLQLEEAGFHVVYFESQEEMEMSDVDAGDILLAIARRVSHSLQEISLEEPKRLQNLLQAAMNFMQTEIELSGEVKTPVGTLKGSSEGQFSLDAGIARITAKTKASPNMRQKLRDFLEPRTQTLLESINQELLEPGTAKLKQAGKQGLVVIVDSLDRVLPLPKPWGRPQQEYLFVDRGEQLRGLHCHVVYTMPLALRFSDEFGRLTQGFLSNPQVLPMVPSRHRDGTPYEEGLSLLRQMVLARAFPDASPEERLQRTAEIFDSQETLDVLCDVSGGHVRNLLRLLNDTIKKDKQFPLSRACLDATIRSYRHERVLAVDEQEWHLLRHVMQKKKVAGDEGYHKLIRSMYVYEYRDRDGYWFDINPILAGAEELK